MSIFLSENQLNLCPPESPHAHRPTSEVTEREILPWESAAALADPSQTGKTESGEIQLYILPGSIPIRLPSVST